MRNGRFALYAVTCLVMAGAPGSHSRKHKPPKQPKPVRVKHDSLLSEVGAFTSEFVAEVAATMAAEHAKRAKVAAVLAGDVVHTPTDVAAAALAVQAHKAQQLQLQSTKSHIHLNDHLNKCADGGKMAAALGRFGANAPVWFNEALPNVIIIGAQKAGTGSAFAALADAVTAKLPTAACRVRYVILLITPPGVNSLRYERMKPV